MDFEAFAAQHYPALSRDEVRYNLPLAILKRGLRDAGHGIRFWTLGGPGCCALQCPGYGIVLGDVDQAGAEALAREVAADDVPNVMGADDTALWFVREARRLGTDYPDVMAQTIRVIDHPPVHPNCDGAVRIAVEADAPLVLAWLQAFVKEAVPDDEMPTLGDASQRISNARVYLWCLDGEAVAMSCVGRELDSGVAIAPVYTPPAHRCRGFAGAATAAIVAEILARGNRYACLFTDDSNPASVRCYVKIGFRAHCKANKFQRRGA